ncbi:MAG: glycosyltransferase family 2 protein [Anaerolineae bacterium]
MAEKPSLSIAMPAYNEAENIVPMLEDVIRVATPLADDYEVIVVDDGSKDDTAAEVRRFAATHPQVRLVQHERNQGYGAAVYSGLTSATKDWVFFTDSDRQFVLDEIVRLLDVREGADLVVGYRSPRRDPPVRLINAWGWNMLVRVLFGPTVRDIDCAFKLMRRQVVLSVAPLVRSRGATLSAEWMVIARGLGFRIREVPVTHRPRVAGRPTGAKPSVVWRAFKELARFRIRLWREGLPKRA